jgi:putative transposase
MTNHVHLLLTSGREDACGLLMRDLGRSYVRYFNRRHGRTGTLWEGRFHACLTESARYVLACYRYIELNPVRAGLAREPADYRWSSYRANSGAAPDPFIKMHPEFLALGQDDVARRLAYRQLFEGQMESAVLKSIREATLGGYPLASDAFKAARLVPAGWTTAPGKPGPRAKQAHGADDCEPA